MTKSRTQNTLYSMAANMLFYAVNILLGLINRKALVQIMGIEYQGVSGLFGSVLSMLGMAELGIGTAIIFHLYKPLAENNIRQIQSIMAFYKKCYRVIAVILLIAGGILCVNIEFFVGTTDLPLDLKAVFLLMLAEVVATYSFTYKRSILYADQKNYIVSNINTFFVLFYNAIQIIALYITKNYYLYLIVKLIFRLVENGMINLFVHKRYGYLKEKNIAPLEEEVVMDIVQKVKGLMFHKIGTFIVNGTDNIFVSKFIGLAAVGVYANYNYVLTAVNSLLNQLMEGATGSVGNLLVKGEKTRRIEVFDELNLLNQYLSTTAIVMFSVTVDDFVSLFFGNEFVMENTVLYMLVLNMMLVNQRRVWGIIKSAAGIQYEDRFVPMAESAVNLIFSFLLLHFWGMAGIFMGTLFTHIGVFIYTFPVLVYKQVLGGQLRNYTSCMIKMFFFQFSIVGTGIAAGRCIQLESLWLNIFVDLCLGFIWPAVSFICFYGRTRAFRALKERVKYILAEKRGYR